MEEKRKMRELMKRQKKREKEEEKLKKLKREVEVWKYINKMRGRRVHKENNIGKK